MGLKEIIKERSNQLEEEKSYSPHFVLLTGALIAVFIWLVVDETYIARPWKGYQKQYYKLEQNYLLGKIMEEQSEFEKSAEYKEYQELNGKLENAKALLNSDDVKDKLKSLNKELRRIKKKELKPVTSELIAARNKKLELEYKYGHYPNKKDYYLEKINGLGDKVAQLEKAQSEVVKKKDAITQKIALINADVDRYTAETKQYTNVIESLATKFEAVKRKRPTLQIYQTFMEETNMADRCTSCHAGIDRVESVSDENPYKAHPKRDYYLGNHPVNIFGCVVCHEGQGRALTSVEEAHGEVEYWLTPLLRGKHAQSSCTKCHGLKADLEEGAPLLVKGKEIFTKRGCYRCHVTSGFEEVEEDERTGPDLTNVAYSTQSDWLVNWIENPKHVRPNTPMPNFGLSREEAETVASYLWQNSDQKASGGNINFDQSIISNGQNLFTDKGCVVCHNDGNKGSDFAPNLFNIGEKLKYDYAVKWLLDPKSFQPKTVMPSFRLNENEAQSIAAYLTTLKTKGVSSNNDQLLSDPAKAEAGFNIIKRYGCFSCHKIKGFEGFGRIGTELSKIGSKAINFLDFGLLEHELLHKVGLKYAHYNVGLTRRVWIDQKLREPRIFDEGRYKLPKDKLRMPNFEFTEDEVLAVTIFLESLVEQELPNDLYFTSSEEQNDLAEGFRLVKKFNCVGCHEFTVDTVVLDDGTSIEGVIKKEKKGKVYFQLWKDSLQLKKSAGSTVRFQKEKIVEHKPAIGGIVHPTLLESLIKNHGISEKEAVNYLPPKLYGQGQKTQSSWLYSFLKSPIILRPWYKAVMPTFNLTDEEAQKIVKYFSKRDGAEYPFEYIKEKDKRYLAKKEIERPNYLETAKELFNSPTVNCASCHIRGDIMPEGKPSGWAPDLSIAKDRLKPSWISNWLKDPQKIQPGTKMPTFFGEGMYQDIMPGTAASQIQAIMDFLMNFNDTPSDSVSIINVEENYKNLN